MAMTTGKVSSEARSGPLDARRAAANLPATAGHPPALHEHAGTRVARFALRGGREERGTLVMAGLPDARRARWIERLRSGLTVCEVADRGVLDRAMASLKPDVLVLDLALPGLCRVGGLLHVQRLSPSTRMIALTDTPSDGEGVSALMAGARGYCARSIDPRQLEKAVLAVRNGEIWASRSLFPLLIAELIALSGGREGDRRSRSDPRLENLTARQRVVADLISRGARNKEIASRLMITERTVKAHLSQAFRTVGVSDRLQLALLLRGDAGEGCSSPANPRRS